jgi:hypothetical protein
MIVLPLSRSDDSFERIPGSFVNMLNAGQVQNAEEHVFMRPGSGLESFVLSERQWPVLPDLAYASSSRMARRRWGRK